MRELDDMQARQEAEQLAAYLEKPGNRGITFWFKSKALSPADEAAIVARYERLHLRRTERPTAPGSTGRTRELATS